MDSELVLHPSRIYSLLGIYIQKSFFSNDKRGDEVFLSLTLTSLSLFALIMVSLLRTSLISFNRKVYGM